jgi:hypothetical protein
VGVAAAVSVRESMDHSFSNTCSSQGQAGPLSV